MLLNYEIYIFLKDILEIIFPKGMWYSFSLCHSLKHTQIHTETQTFITPNCLPSSSRKDVSKTKKVFLIYHHPAHHSSPISPSPYLVSTRLHLYHVSYLLSCNISINRLLSSSHGRKHTLKLFCYFSSNILTHSCLFGLGRKRWTWIIS